MFAAAAAPEGAGRIAVGGGGRGEAQENRQASGGGVEEAGLFQRRNRGISAGGVRESVFHRNERAHSSGASGDRNGYGRGPGEVADPGGVVRKTWRGAGAGGISRARD